MTLFRESVGPVCTIDVFTACFLIHLNARVFPVCQYEPEQEEMPMTASTMLVIIIGVLIFAAFAGSLAWAQLYARPSGAAAVRVVRPKRRAF
jgi:hypothetical protein